MLQRHCLAKTVLCMLVMMSLSLVAYGQSGRRLPKRSETEPPPPPPTKTEPPPELSIIKPDRTLIPLVLARAVPGMDTSSFYMNIVVDHCVQRLRESSFEVSVAPREMNRKEASDLAKSETKSYVAWIELEVDRYVGEDPMGSPGMVHPARLLVNYVIFTPGTGKVTTSGRVYQRPRTIVTTPVPGMGVDPRHNLDGAGRETAER
jgi:hypothetical protein